MKSNTTKEYLYRGDLYSYTVVTSADGTVTNNVYTTTPTLIPLAISVNLLGDLVIESPIKIQLNAYLEKIVDRNGEEIYEGGVWKVFQTAPLLNGLGVKQGYRYRATLIEGQI